MPKPQRVQILAQLQMRIAAIYAIENEDTQRQVRLDQQERRHRQIDTRRHSSTAGSGSGAGGPAGERRSRRATAAALDGGDGDDRTVQGSPSATRRTQATLQDEQGMQQPHLDLQGQMTGSRIMSQQHQQQQQQQQHTQDDVDSFIHGKLYSFLSILLPCPSPSSVETKSRIQLTHPCSPSLKAQFQVPVSQTGAGTPPIGQFHHFPAPPPRRLRGRVQAPS